MNTTPHLKSDNDSGALRCVRVALIIVLTSVILLASVSSAKAATLARDLSQVEPALERPTCAR